MSLSGWDVMQFDADGQFSIKDTVFGKLTVQIYKSYLHCILNKKTELATEYPSGDFSFSFNEGELHTSECVFTGYSTETPQYARFFLVERYEGENKQTRRFCGIVANGYRTGLEYLQIKHPEIYAEIPAKLRKKKDGWAHVSGGDIEGQRLEYFSGEKRWQTPDYPETDYSVLWTGIRPETLQQFLAWLEKECYDKEYVEKVKNAQHLRFDQGDRFFANPDDAASFATPIGGGTTPTIHEVIKKIFED